MKLQTSELIDGELEVDPNTLGTSIDDPRVVNARLLHPASVHVTTYCELWLRPFNRLLDRVATQMLST